MSTEAEEDAKASIFRLYDRLSLTKPPINWAEVERILSGCSSSMSPIDDDEDEDEEVVERNS